MPVIMPLMTMKYGAVIGAMASMTISANATTMNVRNTTLLALADMNSTRSSIFLFFDIALIIATIIAMTPIDISQFPTDPNVVMLPVMPMMLSDTPAMTHANANPIDTIALSRLSLSISFTFESSLSE